MDLKKEKIDDSFDKYALSFAGKTSTETPLPAPILPPLEPPSAAGKELWNARMYHNSLVANPHQTTSLFYLSRDGDLVHIDAASEELHVQKLLSFPQLLATSNDKRLDNPSIRFVAPHMGLLADGAGHVHVFGQSRGHWSILFTVEPFGRAATASASVNLIQAKLTSNDTIHCLVSSLTAKNHRVHALTIHLQSPHQVESVLVFEGGKSVKYAEFKSQDDVVFLVEDTHELKVAIEAAPVSHKRHHEPEGGPVLKAPRAGLGFTGDIPNPEVPPTVSHDDFNKPLYERFQASTTPYSSMDQPLHSAKPIPPPQPSHDAPLEVPTADSLLGGYEECDDIDPNATAIVYSYNFDHKACNLTLPIDCRTYSFLGPSSRDGGNLLFQYDVHGLIYRVDWDPHHLSLVHVHTLPAYGYVQASKNQKKYSIFHPSGSLAILADFEKRVFIYKGVPEPGQKPHTLTSYVHELSSDQAIYGVQFTSESSLVVLTQTSAISISIA